jgi:hypothetical protein
VSSICCEFHVTTTTGHALDRVKTSDRSKVERASNIGLDNRYKINTEGCRVVL